MSKGFQIDHLARLSNLKFSQKEKQKYSAQIASILAYMESLQSVKTDRGRIIGQIAGLKNVWRDDTPQYSLSDKDILANASSVHSGNFQVKAMLENKDN